jgi:hypothetical protein
MDVMNEDWKSDMGEKFNEDGPPEYRQLIMQWLADRYPGYTVRMFPQILGRT